MPTPPSRLRKARAEDLDIILHHRREMFREMGLNDPAGFEKADAMSREFFHKALAEDRYHGWFIEDDEGTVLSGAGIILIEYHPSPVNPSTRRPWVVNVYTEPGSRRQGLARRLMDVLIAWTREQGYANLFLHASHEGRPLYESLGFGATNEMLLQLKD
ncbi:MAG TPA: GNAT family N-acetyltransferase [Bryobacteraceae bacterium]|jgi:GNAT superfamily N-acetyltransferase